MPKLFYREETYDKTIFHIFGVKIKFPPKKYYLPEPTKEKKNKLISSTIPIVLITSDSYSMPTCVAITSMIKNKNSNTVYAIEIFAIEVSQTNKNKLLSLSSDDVKITIHSFDDKYENFGTYHPYVPKADLFKFDIPSVLTQYDKVLYLDGDIIVNSDLAELYSVELQNSYAAVTKDLICTITGKDHIRINRPSYFNAGIMLLNLTKFREDNITEKLLETNEKIKDKYMDQDTFNLVIGDNVTYLSPKYDYFTLYDTFKYDDFKTVFNITKEEFKNLKKSINIFHFAGNKPWRSKNTRYFNIWFKYYKLSPFKNMPLTFIKNKKPLFEKINDNSVKGFYFFGIKFSKRIKSKNINP